MDERLEKREREAQAARRRTVDQVRTDMLETFPYRFPDNPARITTVAEEFTSVCPMTGLPDFGTIRITYVPREKVVELKSLKYYLLQYRDVGVFYEHLVNHIGEHLFALLEPRWLEVHGTFTVRGGLHSEVSCRWGEGA